MSNKSPVVLILARGSGTRFWPFSRRKLPKQLLPIYSPKTLLEETLIRAESITDSSRVLIGTGASLKKKIQKSHPSLKDKQFIVEPQAKNTAPIIALAALEIAERYGDVPFIVLSADHYIHPLSKFKKVMKSAVTAAEAGYLVTVGITPNRPETGYGYLKRGKAIKKSGPDTFELKEFKEKPDAKTAARYVKNGSFFWNAGIFAWRTDILLEELKIHSPKVVNPLLKRFPFRKAGDLKKAFELTISDSIDFALMEKSERLAMVTGDFVWDDVGSWLAMGRFIKPNADGNFAKGAPVFSRDAEDNLVISKKQLVALLGVDNLAIIEDDDVLFIADKSKLDDIKPMLQSMDTVSSLKKFL